MKSYEEIRSICERSSQISERVVDDFLIPFAAGHQGMEKKMNQKFDRYRHVGKKLGKRVLNLLKAQYLAHQVFRSGGLLGKFLKHPALGRFTGADLEYLSQQLKLPWRFSFSVIVDRPAKDFFQMEDVFTGKRFLLFSPVANDILDSSQPLLWFNLIGFNGACWQTYGPVVYYQGFEPDDIWFFATEVNPELAEWDQLPAEVEKNPLPFLMLVSGSSLPLTFHQEDQLIHLLEEHEVDKIDTAALKKVFRTEYHQGVYRVSHEKWSEHPHFCQAYYDEEKHILLFSGMTDRGYQAFVRAFNALGYDFPAEPYLRVNMGMLNTAQEILKREVELNEYEDHFREEPDPQKEKFVEDINAFMALVLPDINAGRVPDIEAAARKTGVDPESARGLIESVMGSLDRMPGKAPEPHSPEPGLPGSGAKKQASGSEVKVQDSSKKLATTQLPPQPKEGIRLLSRDDELLFDLHFYMLAEKIRRLAPWEYLEEHEIFGVQVPGKDLVYFVSVMGADGEFEALSFYKGYSGLASFLEYRDELDRLFRQQNPEVAYARSATMVGGTMCIPHLMLSFTDREELDSKQLAAIRKSGVRFRGKGNWPRIEEIVPGYVPVYPGRESLVEIYLVMQQVLSTIEKIEKKGRYLLAGSDSPGTYLVRVPYGKGPRFKWKEHWLLATEDWAKEDYTLQVPAGRVREICRLPEASQEIQLELFMLPSPVKMKGGKAYFPFPLLLADKAGPQVVSTSVLAPHPDLASMYESVPAKVLDELLKLGHRPAVIEIRTDLLHDLLGEILEQAACPVRWVNEMPEMDEFITGMIDHLSR